MNAASARRGQPLLLLGLILTGWGALRLMLWETPFALTEAASVLLPGANAAEMDAASVPGAISAVPTERGPLASAALVDAVLPLPVSPGVPFASAAASPVTARGPVRSAPPIPAAPRLPGAGAEAAAVVNVRPAAASASRWSADGWVLLRQDGSSPLQAGQPSYGRSQAGAALRYRLDPRSAHAPQAYLRAAAALDGPREEVLAAGLSARVARRMPLRLAAELRIAETGGGTDLRPAAFAVTELPPLALPLGARAEAYVQAGYVGGDASTAFVDGQVRLDRKVAELGGATFLAGAGAWGGAQRGAERLDIGPSASIFFPLGAVYSRLAVDYRFRMAGDAQPASGPALTLSTGF